jgi:hypothetical protein
MTYDTDDRLALSINAENSKPAETAAPTNSPTPGLEWLGAAPAAWRPALAASLSRGGISSAGAEGIDALRQAAYQADRACELLGDAVAWETNPDTAALFDNLRLAALHLLVVADHVARGGDLRAVTKAVEVLGAGFGQFKTAAQDMGLKRGVALPFDEWSSAAAPDPEATGETEASAIVAGDTVEVEAGK